MKYKIIFIGTVLFMVSSCTKKSNHKVSEIREHHRYAFQLALILREETERGAILPRDYDDLISLYQKTGEWYVPGNFFEDESGRLWLWRPNEKYILTSNKKYFYDGGDIRIRVDRNFNIHPKHIYSEKIKKNP